MDLLDTLIETLKDKMNDHSLSAAQLAKRTGLDHNTVHGWLYENSHPRIHSLIKVADYFKCSLDYLFGLTEEPRLVLSEKPATFVMRLDHLEAAHQSMNDNKLAKVCGVGNSAVAKWRRFGNYPDILTIIKLTEFFGCSIEYIIGRSDS